MILHETIFFFFRFTFIRFTEECMLMRVVNIFKVVVRKMGRQRKTITKEKQQNNEKQPKQAADDKEAKKDIFSWSDDEIQLLLIITLDFKSRCGFKGMNWESKISKYERIFELMMKQYPMTVSENYQNKNLLNKVCITAKLKSIRTGFKKAADAVKKSGGDRVVFTFYDLCANLWGGSPAVTSLPYGVDTSGQNRDNETEGNEPQSPTYFPQTETNPESLVADDQEDLVDVERDDKIHNETKDKGNENVRTGKSELSKVNKAATERRQDVKNMLKNRKDKEMAAKLGTESQLLQICRDDLDFNKKILEKIDESDKEFRAGFTELNKTMSTIGTAIQQSVGIIVQLVGQDMPNHTRMLLPQTYQDQMHQHQMHQYHASTTNAPKSNYLSKTKGIPSM